MCRPNANLFLFFVIVWHLFFALYPFLMFLSSYDLILYLVSHIRLTPDASLIAYYPSAPGLLSNNEPVLLFVFLLPQPVPPQNRSSQCRRL